MILSTRSTPPKALNLSLSPASSQTTSLRLKHLLLTSPLPSPSLPSILPRHGKKPPRVNSRKAVRVLCWLAILVSIYEVYCRLVISDPQLTRRNKNHSARVLLEEIVADSNLPDFPTPIALVDLHGKQRWTVSIPSNSPFPLSSSDYADICSRARNVAAQVAPLHFQSLSPSPNDLYSDDPSFIDVAEAKAAALLPDDHLKEDLNPSALPICRKSLTFMFDASTAGLGPQLLHLWLAYGLAKREKRSFFIEDSNFAYGSFITYFPPLQPPNCRLPDHTHIVPWPRQARHLIVSVATSEWMFGESLHNHFGRREMFNMMREGYQMLWGGKLVDPDDEQYARTRIRDIRDFAQTEHAHIVGIHIRRGDRHPHELQYRGSYIPLDRFVGQPFQLKDRQVKILAASDDPDIYAHTELQELSVMRAQDRISLASKGTSGENGWEGGFFKDIFWALGSDEQDKRHTFEFGSRVQPSLKKSQPPSSDAHPTPPAPRHRDDYILPEDPAQHHKSSSPPSPTTLQLRQYLARAYLLDLTILARASDRVVCTASSAACRILALMMGWDRAVAKEDWINVDHGVLGIGVAGVE